MTNPINALKMGGKAAVLAALMAGTAYAQTATPPAELTTMDEVQFPTLQGTDTDEQVITALTEQGYENLVITRADDTLVVTGERGGLPTEMVFSAADGTLVLVDGVEPAAPATTGMGTADAATTAATTDAVPATDGDEPPSETPASSNFSGQDQQPLDTPTASVEGDDVDPVNETIPAEAAVPAPEGGEAGQDADGGAETDGEG